MPSYSLIKELHCNTVAEVSSPLLASKSTASARATGIVWALRDKFPIRIYLLQPTGTVGESPEVLSLSAGSTLHMAARPKNILATEDDLLAASCTLTAATDADTDPCFDGVLSLRNSALIALFTSGVKSLTLTCDVEVVNTEADRNATVCQFDATVLLDVRRDEDSDPGEGVSMLFPRVYSSIAALQAVDSLNAALPRVACLSTAEEGLGFWQLTAGTAAHNPSGGIIRPTDYATTTNERVWIRAL
jgi:hypothetical protein